MPDILKCAVEAMEEAARILQEAVMLLRHEYEEEAARLAEAHQGFVDNLEADHDQRQAEAETEAQAHAAHMARHDDA